MVNRTLARRYATAVYSLAVERDAVESIGADLARIAEALQNDATAQQFFLAPIIDRYQKERTLTAVFEGRVHEVALHTFLLLVRKHREALLGALIEEYRVLELAGRGVEPLTITSARPLSEREIEETKNRIARIYGRAFEARVVVDPALVGGMRIAMGDRVIDGTVAGRLEELARELAGVAAS
jgi:F-type H+-transporting ATPase subunit delta